MQYNTYILVYSTVETFDMVIRSEMERMYMQRATNYEAKKKIITAASFDSTRQALLLSCVCVCFVVDFIFIFFLFFY